VSRSYAETADSLTLRIVALIPSHPEILELTSPWGLFKVEGFECADLQPTMFQADVALSKAKQQWAEQQKAGAL